MKRFEETLSYLPSFLPYLTSLLFDFFFFNPSFNRMIFINECRQGTHHGVLASPFTSALPGFGTTLTAAGASAGGMPLYGTDTTTNPYYACLQHTCPPTTGSV